MLSKGGVSYREALEMSNVESMGVWIALREMNGYTYLGRGRWKEPEWMTQKT